MGLLSLFTSVILKYIFEFESEIFCTLKLCLMTISHEISMGFTKSATYNGRLGVKLPEMEGLRAS